MFNIDGSYKYTSGTKAQLLIFKLMDKIKSSLFAELQKFKFSGAWGNFVGHFETCIYTWKYCTEKKNYV